MLVKFTPGGAFWGFENSIIDEEHIEATVPDGIDAWRLSYDLSTNSPVIRYNGLTNTEALTQLEIDNKPTEPVE